MKKPIDSANGTGSRSSTVGGPVGANTGRRRGGGPNTPEGKAVSSRNAIKHGIFSSDPTAGGELSGEFEAYREALVADLGARGLTQTGIVYQ